MDLGKLLLSSSAAIAISASVVFGDPPIREASLNPKESDFIEGVYVDYVESFVPGKHLKYWKERINNVLGKQKYRMEDSLSLGHEGEVVVSYTGGMKNKDAVLCFKKKDNGPAFYVHEANNESNKIETVEVFVTPNEYLNEKTKWISLGVKSVNDGKNNWIPFDMPENIKEAYRIKLKDGGSKKSVDTISYAGFDASAVLLTNPCVPTS